jgi:hypothetical protein
MFWCRELKDCDGYLRNVLWLPETYDGIAAAIENNEVIEETFSLRGRCVLNELSTFHATTSFVPDLMHDFLGQLLRTLMQILITKSCMPVYHTSWSYLSGRRRNANW